jgi:transposase InsO family protein
MQDGPERRGDTACWGLIVSVQTEEPMSLEEIRAFLEASEGVGFQGRNRKEVYGWVNEALRQQHYEELKRASRGLVRRYVSKMTGLSRAQTARLIGVYQQGEPVQLRPYRRQRFPVLDLREDIALLASLDEAHGTLSGPATRKLLERAYDDFGDPRYRRLARISVAHLYRLRSSRAYRQKRVRYEVTRPTAVSIGERRRPEPHGRPGYLRVDTVHQGDRDGVKGVYHINAVDEVTQFEVVGAVPQISEAWLLPVLEAMLRQFPFQIRGFHSDNGSEFINHTVAKLLEKLLIEQTKSRPRHSNDNGQVEAKNGAVVRKHMGYTHIAAPHAAAIERFYEEHFNPYLNFHRPCGVPETVVNRKGKEKRVYRWYATPWEILRQIPDLAREMRDGITIAELEQRARARTDTQAAEEMQEAKRKLFASFAPGRGTASPLPWVGPGQRLQMESGNPPPATKGERTTSATSECLPSVGLSSLL